MASRLIVRNRSEYLGTGITRLHHASAQKHVQRLLWTTLLQPQQAHAGERNVVGRVGFQRPLECLLGSTEMIDERFERSELALVASTRRVESERLLQVAARGNRVFELALCRAQRIPRAIVGG